MGYQFTAQGANAFFKHLSPNYVIYAPKRFIENGAPADNYCARYGTVNVVEEIVAVKKAAFSFSDLLASIEQSLFSFIDDAEPMETGKEAIVFLRSCDLHAVKQLDAIYLNSRNPDYFYKKIRDKIHFVLMGCSEPFDDCFCVEQGTNISTDYSGAVNITKRGYTVD